MQLVAVINIHPGPGWQLLIGMESPCKADSYKFPWQLGVHYPQSAAKTAVIRDAERERAANMPSLANSLSHMHATHRQNSGNLLISMHLWQKEYCSKHSLVSVRWEQAKMDPIYISLQWHYIVQQGFEKKICLQIISHEQNQPAMRWITTLNILI